MKCHKCGTDCGDDAYLAYRTPRFSRGDLIEYDLSYARVVYQVEDIRWSDGLHYVLKGVEVLESNGTQSPVMTEAKRYDPFCEWFDPNATLWKKPRKARKAVPCG